MSGSNPIFLRGVRDELSGWLQGFPWDFWFTGTFRSEMNVKDTFRAKKYFNSFIKDIERTGVPIVDYFMAVERFKDGEFTHVHALLNKVRSLRYLDVWEKWFKRYGRALVEGYDPKLGAAHYLTKYVVKELCDWDLRIMKPKS